LDPVDAREIHDDSAEQSKALVNGSRDVT